MQNKTKNDIIVIAQKNFFLKGYSSTSLQDIANELNIKPASLYYHFSGGKEEIYIEVLINRLKEYKIEIESNLEKSNQLLEFLKSFAYWYVSQPQMNMDLIVKLDMPNLTVKSKQIIMKEISNSIFNPLNSAFEKYKTQLKNIKTMNLVGLYLNMLNGIIFATNEGYVKKEGLIEDYLEIFLNGINIK